MNPIAKALRGKPATPVVGAPLKNGDAALKSIKSLRKGTLKVHPGLSHGMLTVNADTLNADLLAFVEASHVPA